MAISSGGGEQTPESLELGRAPVDKLLLACVLAASTAYVVFLIVMQLTPREAERADRQGYLGVVSGESQPNGRGAGEEDPAAGVAERGGRGSAYYVGNGQPPRPVTLAESSTERAKPPEGAAAPRRPTRIPATHVQTVQTQTSETSGMPKLGLTKLVAARVEQLGALRLSAPEPDPASALGPTRGALNPPPGHVRVGVGPH
ncbi:hypothetical protein [Enhygromyxa salina]|uniref:Uncharacterized protein n=1 Tax=Enhygromyxa salina TaxID=215803 RepID=A0A2S9XQF5_9BACT|nr:hypothetical protein [Enhygromyxa salina]PRP95093.1 hypothetical protein ENSA7_74070 [Enhygromyxa salina]